MTTLSPSGAAPALGGSVARGGVRIRELDALRGIAALVVFIHHVFVIFNDEVRSVVTGAAFAVLDVVQAQNKAAVLTFFVLSGYAIGLATRGREPVTRSALADYASRRARRILPLYWISLAWTAALGWVYAVGEPSFSLETLIGNILFLQTSAIAKGNWFDPFGLNGPYWSLSYEVFFYAMLPAVLLVTQKRSFASHPRTVLVGLGCAATFVGFSGNNLLPSPFSEFLVPWVVWLVGYVAVDLQRGPGSVLLVAAPMVCVGAAVGALSLLGLHSDTLNTTLEGTVIAFAFALVALYPGFMSWHPLRQFRRILVALFSHIGDGGYALYLLHYPLLLALHDLLGAPFGAFVWWVTGAGLIAFVVVFCPWLELTSVRLARRPRPSRSAPE